MTKIRNPYSLPTDGQTRVRSADWIRFEGLSEKEKLREIERLGVGLAPAEKTPALSKEYPNKKSGALDLARHIRHGTNDGQTLYDFWLSIMDGTNKRFEKIDLSDSLEASRLMAQYGFARMAQMDEKGVAVKPTINMPVQVIYNNDWRTPETVKVVEGEAKPLDDGHTD